MAQSEHIFIKVHTLFSYSYQFEAREEDDDGKFLDGTGYGQWGRLFLSSKNVSFMTRKQRRTVLLFDIAYCLEDMHAHALKSTIYFICMSLA